MLFDEIYGRYYLILYKLLEYSRKCELTDEDAKRIIEGYGYEESMLHLYPKVTDEKDPDFYQLFKKTGSGYDAVLNHTPEAVMTSLQKSWLKSMLKDSRIRLFFDEDRFKVLEEAFEGAEILYDDTDYVMVGQSLDGDPYDDVAYKSVFRQILVCLKQNALVKVTYVNRFGESREGFYAPYRLEYSIKDDKFRLNAVQVERGKMLNYSRLNLARIKSVQPVEGAKVPKGIETFILNHKVSEPVVIRLSDSRNGFDRCFIHLSNYERRAEYDEETGESIVNIYYYDFEETELLITLMSYGPILEVLGPPEFRSKFADRIRRQIELNSI